MQPLRFATAGSVDDGKSTLIGRLLYDARAVQEDQLAAVERASQRRGAAQIDLSLLTDGLEAEREQGITIDVAYRYFATPRRKFIIADGPGHVQYTRNMATGASNADALVLLLDVKEGLKEQTKKHLQIARLLGIRQVVAFLNKMDIVDWSREAFDAAATGLKAFAAPLGLESLDIIPGSALLGDMVVERGPLEEMRLGWYRGPTLLERLETLHAGAESAASGPFRFPVQLVSRPQDSAPRGYMGRIESGHLLIGTEVTLLPSGRRSRVRQILTHGASRELAVAGDSVTLVLADDIDLARGDLIADPVNAPRETRALEVTLVWLGHETLRPGGRYLVQMGSRRVLAKVQSEAPLALNDIGQARLTLNAPLFVDSYDLVRATGSLILIDEATNHTVAAGLVK
jgi:sulfate adenylyltransferase large subunit